MVYTFVPSVPITSPVWSEYPLPCQSKKIISPATKSVNPPVAHCPASTKKLTPWLSQDAYLGTDVTPLLCKHQDTKVAHHSTLLSKPYQLQ